MPDSLSNAIALVLTAASPIKPKLSAEESRHAYRLASKEGTCGSYYGYPKCCISHYKRPSFNWGVSRREIQFGLLGTGFRPCPECQVNKTLSQIYQEIGLQRICHMPFPLSVDDLPNNLSTRECAKLVRFIDGLRTKGVIPDPELMDYYRIWKLKATIALKGQWFQQIWTFNENNH